MTNAEHRHLRLLLAHYRELDDPARTAVDAHLLTCSDCRLALAAYAEHEALLLRGLPARAPSPRLAAGLHRQLTPRHLGVPWYRRLGNELVFAAGVALLVLTFMGVIRLQQQRPQITAGTATPISIVAPAASATPIASITTAPSALVSPTPAAAQTPAATPGTPAPTWPWLVYTLDTNNSRSLYTARVDGSDTRLLHRWPTRLPGAPALSLDGRWLAYGLDGLWLLPLNGEAALNLLPPDRVNGQVTALAWAPDSLALALVIQRPNDTYQVTIVRLQADLPTDNFSFDQGYPRLLGWNADANTVLVLLSANAQEDSSGQIQALTPGQPVASQPYLYEAGPNWRLHAPTLGPRGRSAYYLADSPQGASVLVRQDLSSGRQTIALSATLPIENYVLAPDEDYVMYTVTAEKRTARVTDVRLLAFASGKPSALTALPGAGARLLTWSPAIPNALDAWVLWEPALDTTGNAGQSLHLLRPSDQVSTTLSLPVSALHVAGWRTAPPPAAPAADETNFDAVLASLDRALAENDGPGLAHWLTDQGWVSCTYGQPCDQGPRTTAAGLATLLRALNGSQARIEAQRLPVNPPDFQPPGEATVLVRRQTNAGASDSLHLYLHRRADNTWRVVGALLDIPYYDAPALADVRAAPAAFAGREVVMTGAYLTSAAGDLPADAPRLGQWVLRDSSGASVWGRNASADLTQGLLDGSEVQVFGLLKMEQGWPFLEVRFVQALPAAGS